MNYNLYGKHGFFIALFGNKEREREEKKSDPKYVL
jgi:hypothetical protein